MSWGDVQFEVPSSDADSLAARSLWRVGPLTKMVFVYAGVFLPVTCFLITRRGPVEGPDWQSGNLHDYFAFLLSGQTAYVFYPLLVYAMASLWLVLFNVGTVAESFLIRWGVYSGVLLALHFSVVHYVVVFDVATVGPRLLGLPVVIAVAIGVPAIVWMCVVAAAAVFQRQDATVRRYLLFVLLLIVLVAAVIAVSFAPNQEGAIVAVPFLLFIFGSFFCAPYWTLGVFGFLSVRLIRQRWQRGQFRLSHLLFVFTWLAAYLAAARYAVTLALEQYAQLPTEPPPDCYIATAAARGHRRFVRAEVMIVADGRRVRVNLQLAALKCGEVAIRTLFPHLHVAMRKVYDRLGPPLAARIRNPLLADLAYLSLKPCEWAARVGLQILLPGVDRRVSTIYAPAAKAARSREGNELQ